jgi:phosphoribosylformylglycinamidine synthase subunit PurSL
MVSRIEVVTKEDVFDPQGYIASQRILDSLGLDVFVECRKIFSDNLSLNNQERERFAKELVHPVTHIPWIKTAVIEPIPHFVTHVLEVGYGPGVMDPEGRSARSLAEIIFRRKFPADERVAVQHQFLLKPSSGKLSEIQLKKIAGLFENEIVQTYQIWTKEEFEKGIEPYLPNVKVPPPEPVKHYDLNVQEDELKKISEERVLALNLEEMLTIQKYYNKQDIIDARKKVGLDSKATDVELELLGQTWSEHCKHKIFNADITYKEFDLEDRISEGIFKRFIKNPTLEIQKSKPDFIMSVLADNSGVVDLDPRLKHYLCFKVETHNSPSFIEPYGGAITGIVGVYRDPMGTGRGSMLTFGVWGYCLGSIFYKGILRPPLHPNILLDGIHWGVRDGGNKHGVPTAIGDAFFDPSFMGKCLVYVGAAGLIPKNIDGRPGYEKWVDPGDRCIVVGGRVGRDGIHGATASSQEYSSGTPKGHVQIGDPYTQKNVQEFLLEALAEGLINFSQDSGAGGTASAAGEMAAHCGKKGGAVINLEKDLFKYGGLTSWQKLLSESQERMFLAVNPSKLERLVQIAEKWNVEWRDIGHFEDSGYFHVKDGKETVSYLDMKFLHEGVPQKKLNAVWKTPEERGLKELNLEDKIENHGKLLHKMLGRENIASKEFLQREYDTRVQGRTVIPPLIGSESDVPSEAFVQKIEFDKDIGVACGIGFNPSYSKIDTYHMAMLAANQGLMKVIAVGANPDKAANNGNYCWPGVLPEEAASKEDAEYKLAQLVRAAQAQRKFAEETECATISGKDSMKIQGKIKDEQGNTHTVYGLPSLQFATIATVPDIKKCMTPDFKKQGDLIYVIGLTKDELGASELYEYFGGTGVNVPKVDIKNAMDVYRKLYSAIQDEKVESVKVSSKGGLAVATAIASFGGNLGARIDLREVPNNILEKDSLDTRILYSESPRFIVTVSPGNKDEFEKILGKYASPIGQVTEKEFEVIGTKGDTIIKEDNYELKSSWKSTFKHKMYQNNRK